MEHATVSPNARDFRNFWQITMPPCLTISNQNYPSCSGLSNCSPSCDAKCQIPVRIVSMAGPKLALEIFLKRFPNTMKHYLSLFSNLSPLF